MGSKKKSPWQIYSQKNCPRKNSPGKFTPSRKLPRKKPRGKNSARKKSRHPNFFPFSFCNFFELLLIFVYVIFKILLYYKLIFSLIEFNLAALCNLVIWKHLSLSIG